MPVCCSAGASNWASWRRSSSAWASACRNCRFRLARAGGFGFFGGFGSGGRGTSQPDALACDDDPALRAGVAQMLGARARPPVGKHSLRVLAFARRLRVRLLCPEFLELRGHFLQPADADPAGTVGGFPASSGP